MADHTDNNIRAAVRALTDVVAPAVDATNPLAQEQLSLVVSWLEFYRSRLPLLRERDRLELTVQLELGRNLLEEAPSDDLVLAVVRGTDVLDDVNAGAPDIREATEALENAVSALVRASPDFAEDQRRSLERIVLRHTKNFLDAQRAWFLPISVEPDPDELPPLEVALRVANSGPKTPSAQGDRT